MSLTTRHVTSEPTPDAETTAPVLVLGIGNILLRDEGVGVRVIEAMRSQPNPPGIELLDGGTSGFDLVDAIAGRRKLIVVDAMDADAPPGTVRRLSLDDLRRETQAAVSLHEFGLLDTLHAAELMDCAPHEVVIFGVQPAVVELGLELSREVGARIPEVIAEILAELQDKQTP